MPRPRLTTQYVADSFGWNAVAKARVLCKQGDVLEWSFNIDGTKVMGGVRDSQRAQPYRVALNLYDSRDSDEAFISGQCSCHAERGCLHGVALALTLLEAAGQGEEYAVPVALADLPESESGAEAGYPEKDSDLEPGAAVALSSSQTADIVATVSAAADSGTVQSAVLAPSLASSWLNRLISTWQRSSAEKRLDEFVVYKIGSELQLGELELRVEPCIVKRLKTGALGAPRPYNWRQLAAGQARYVQAEDRAIADLWVRCSAKDSQVSQRNDLLPPQDPEVLYLLLARIIGSGRAFADGKPETPLALGPEKEGYIEWRAHADSRQSPLVVLDDPSVKILGAACPWYLDTAECLAGPVKLPFNADVVQALLAAPRLTPKEAAAICPELERLSELLPLPVSELEQEVRSAEPVPCLHLKFIKYNSVVLVRDGDKDLCLEGENTAVLSFDYGFDTSRLSELWQKYHWVDGKTSIVTHRNVPGEERCFNLLQSRGFSRTANARLPKNLISFVARQQSQQTWYVFLQETLPQLKKAGWQITTDDSFKYQVLETDSDWILNIDAGDSDWFSLELGIDLDDKRIPLLPVLSEALQSLPGNLSVASLERLNKDGKFYAPMPDGRLLAFPFERVKSILSCLLDLFDRNALHPDGRLDISLPHVMALLECPEEAHLKWMGDEALRSLAGRIKDFDINQEINVPDGLSTTLRSYQKDGLRFLEFISACNLGGILADDMGLGKTVQALAHILREKELGRLSSPVLVLCPTSVVPNWVAEARRLSPGLNVLSLQGANRAEKYDDIASCDLVISTYPVLVRDFDKLSCRRWHAVVLDEAQAIKNHTSKSAKAVLQLDSGYRLALTGTPIENHLGELWSQFRFLMPGLLGSRKTFENVFQRPIEDSEDSQRLELLNRRIEPFILRRTKDKVAADLPRKTTIIKYVELEGRQCDLYETVRLSMHKHVLEEVTKRGLASCQLLILDALMKMRQVCCDPRLVKLPEAAGVTESAKLECLLNMIDELLEEKRRILVFSQFTSMLDLIALELQKKGIDFVELRGETKDRLTPVTRFQQGEVPVFLISLKAGGTGLNLTAADTVIQYDPWWNPAVEEQASDRAHRIGQDKPVFVYRLVATGTIEELIVDLQERKRALAGGILDRAGVADFSLRFNELDLSSMFTPLVQSDSGE